jgi:hypothetical protein
MLSDWYVPRHRSPWLPHSIQKTIEGVVVAGRTVQRQRAKTATTRMKATTSRHRTEIALDGTTIATEKALPSVSHERGGTLMLWRRLILSRVRKRNTEYVAFRLFLVK